MSGEKIKFEFLTFGKREIKYYVAVCVVIVALMWTWGYASLLNSEEYVFGQRFIETNQKVTETVGKIKSSRPGFSNFKRRYAGGAWTSKFEIVLTGEVKTATADLDLSNTGSGWTVQKSKLVLEDGTAVDLSP